jgi:hypothetical protein
MNDAIHIHSCLFGHNIISKQRRQSEEKSGQSTDAGLPGYFLVGETRLRILPLPVPPRYLLDRDCINIKYTKIFFSVETITRENRLKYVIFFLLLKERENDR